MLLWRLLLLATCASSSFSKIDMIGLKSISRAVPTLVKRVNIVAVALWDCHVKLCIRMLENCVLFSALWVVKVNGTSGWVKDYLKVVTAEQLQARVRLPPFSWTSWRNCLSTWSENLLTQRSLSTDISSRWTARHTSRWLSSVGIVLVIWDNSRYRKYQWWWLFI